MNFMPALWTRQPVGHGRFLNALPAQMPVMRGAVVDVVRVLLAATGAFDFHGGSSENSH